jgi:hypothetical protein
MSAPFVTMLLLRSFFAFDAAKVENVLSTFPGSLDVNFCGISADGNVLKIAIDDLKLSAMMISDPIPVSEFAKTFEQPHSQKLEELVDTHNAHLIITCREPGASMGDAVAGEAFIHMLSA